MPIIKVNDIKMYYEIHGTGRPVLLICGLGTGISAYGQIIDRLSGEYKLIVFDNRGVGKTDKPDIPYTIEMMADDTAGLLKAIGILQADVIGISMGGRIAMALALKYPKMVKSLVLTSTSSRHTQKIKLPFLAKPIKLVRSSKIFGKNGQPYYAFNRQLKASQIFDCSKKLYKIEVPTLILHGKDDAIVPFELAEEMHKEIKDSQIIGFKGGHMFFFWRNEKFVDVVLEFLDTTN